MRKSALVLALVMVASGSTTALAAKKAPADPNAGGKKFFYELAMQPSYVVQNGFGFNPAPKKKK